jgi:hypothetical protein
MAALSATGASPVVSFCVDRMHPLGAVSSQRQGSALSFCRHPALTTHAIVSESVGKYVAIIEAKQLPDAKKWRSAGSIPATSHGERRAWIVPKESLAKAFEP